MGWCARPPAWLQASKINCGVLPHSTSRPAPPWFHVEADRCTVVFWKLTRPHRRGWFPVIATPSLLLMSGQRGQFYAGPSRYALLSFRLQHRLHYLLVARQNVSNELTHSAVLQPPAPPPPVLFRPALDTPAFEISNLGDAKNYDPTRDADEDPPESPTLRADGESRAAFNQNNGVYSTPCQKVTTFCFVSGRKGDASICTFHSAQRMDADT